AVRGAIKDLAAGRIDGAQDAARGGGLAAARFAHQPQGLALVQGEIDAVDGADMAGDALEEALGDREEFLQAAHFQQGFGHSASALSWCRKQLASWLAATGSSFGTAAEQRSITSGQRGWNGQPGGRLKGWGRAPEITGSATRVSPYRLGIERSSARV